jgi:nucleoid DNA-binding protein
MASKIQAVNAYRPKVKLGRTVPLAQLVNYIADRTGLNEGEVSIVLKELRDAVIFFTRQGQGVKIEGLGTYLPKVGLDGTFDVSHRLDRAIKNALNAPGAFSGQIVNRENVGQTADDLVALWNADHPDDPVV